MSKENGIVRCPKCRWIYFVVEEGYAERYPGFETCFHCGCDDKQTLLDKHSLKEFRAAIKEKENNNAQ